MFYRMPRNLRTLPTVRCRDTLLTSVLNRNHVSEGNLTSRNLATSSSSNVFESPIFISTSVHVERANPVLGDSASFLFAGVGCHTLRKLFVFHRQQQVKPQPSKQQQTSPSRRQSSQDHRTRWEMSHADGRSESRVHRVTIQFSQIFGVC